MIYGFGRRGGTPGGRFGGAFPEDAAEPRVDEEEDDEGMAEPVVDTETVAAATAGVPIEALLRPMARLLTGPRPEGADTVAEPTEEV